MLRKNISNNKKGISIISILLVIFVFLMGCISVKAANFTVTYDYNGTYSIASNTNLNTGYKVNWNNQFIISLTFSVSSINGSTMLIFSNRNGNSVSLDSYLTEGGNFNLWVGSVAITCANAITAGKTYRVSFWWIPDSQGFIVGIYDMTNGGNGTSVCQQSNTVSGVSGTTSNPVYVNGDVNNTSSLAMSNVKLQIIEVTGSTISSFPSPNAQLLYGYGYNAGWYDTASGGTKKTSVSDTTTLYLQKEAKTYTVTLNGQSATTSSSPTTVYYKYGTNKYYSNSSLSTQISSITVPQKTGYTFGGFYTGTSGTGTQYINSSGSFVNSLYNSHNNNTTSRTLYAKWTLATPAAPTISGGRTIEYNNAMTTVLDCSTTTTYASGTDLYYQFGYSTTTTGSVTWLGSASTTHTYEITSTSYVAQRYYKCRVYAKNGSTTSSTVTSSSYTEMTINNSKMSFDATTRGGTLSGNTPLYFRYGQTGFYTGIRNTTAATIPTASKTGRTFLGWYTQAGTKVIDSSNNIIASVSGWTDANKKWTNSTGDTLQAHYGITNPATPTISGGGSKIYGSSGNITVTCSTSTTYSDSSISINYQIGYATSSGGTSITWINGERTDGIFTAPTSINPQQRWYACRARASAGTDYSDWVSTSASVLVAVIRATITFDATTNGGTGNTQLYSQNGQSNLWTAMIGGTTASIPTASSNGGTFNGWWTAATGGSKVINADGTKNTVSNWTNSSGAFLRTANSTLYAQYDQNTYTISLNNQSATSAGTQTAYYKYYTAGSSCNYYSNNTLTTCLTTITKPTKTGYTFKGYYTQTNGGGTQYINASGQFVNDLYKKTPKDINSSYTTTVTLYAYWEPATYTISLNNQSATTAGTQTAYYKYNTAGTSCNYYSNNTLTTCLTTITKPTKTNYVFKGYYSATNGGGTQYINANGQFVNDLYKKAPSEISSSYTTTVTLYAYWEPATYTISLNNQSATTAGTANAYYKYNTAGTSCNYYSNNTLTTCLTTITKPTKTNYVFKGYYSEINGGGTQYINANGQFVNDLYKKAPSEVNSNYTTTVTLYAYWEPATYTIVFNNQNATSAGTVNAYYKYNTVGTSCNYYSNNTLTTCLTTITKPERTNYIFKGYYSETNGGGTQYINTDGQFINNLYTKAPSEVNSSYTDTITLYADWELNTRNLTYDYQLNKSFTDLADSYLDIGYTVDFSKDFEIETTFRVSELDVRHPIVSSYNTAYSNNKFFHIDINNNNTIRVFSGSNSAVTTSATTIAANEDIYLKYTWNAITKTFTLTATGTNTNISMTNTYSSLSGACVRTLWTGNVRGRGNGYYGSINIKSLKITESNVVGTVLTALPEVADNRQYVTWYESPTSEERITTVTVDDDKTLYGKVIPIYRVILNNENADTAGTTEYYYAYNISRVIDNATCYYYTDSKLEYCITSIEVPTKANNNFGGYFTEENGEGAPYVTQTGTFTNNIYKKNPVDINEEYFYDITLYAKWREIYTLTYDYQNDDTFSGNSDSFFDTGYTVNFNKDFAIEETFRVSELGNHYYLIGSYHASYSSNKFFQISVNTDNTIRVYVGSISNYIDSVGTINANEDINLKLTWDAETQTYTLTAKGTVTDITMSETYAVTGSTVRTLVLGTDRGRSSGYWSPIEISNLKISNEEDFGNVIALPQAAKTGYKLGWYDQATGGNKIETYTVDGNKTLYVQWIDQNKLTYDYQVNQSFDGTPATRFNTGYQLNFNKDFEIEETFSVSSLGSRALIISSIYNTERPAFMIEKNAADKIRVYMRNELSSSHDLTSTETVPANEDITIKFVWDAGSKTYTLTATGATTNISFSGYYEIKGYTNRTLALGQDHRTTIDFGSVTIKSLKITESEDANAVISELPGVTKEGAKLVWYNAPSNGTKVSSVTMDSDKTIYAHWEETANVTYDYIFNSPLEFTGRDKSYFDTDFTIDWSKDFEIEEVVKLPELGQRYLIFGGYNIDSDLGNRINVEFTASGNIRIFGKGEGGYVTDRQDSTGTLYANEDITVKFTWNSGTQQFTITAQGAETDMTLSASMTGMAGRATRPLRLGQDYRAAAVYGPMEVSKFKVTVAEEKGKVITDFPEVSVDDTELNWYTSDFGGTEVVMHTVATDTILYGHYPIYSVTLDDEDADTAGTTKVYYEYNTNKVVDRTTCYYFSDSALTSCITAGNTINLPTKEDYTFGGYYAKENGLGMQYITSAGIFTNNIWKKKPNEIDENYTDDTTLYAKWSHEQTLTYNYNMSEALEFDGTSTSFFDTGYIVNFDKDFEIEATFKVDDLSKPHELITSYHVSQQSSKFIHIAVRETGQMRVFLGNTSTYYDSEGLISTGEDITLKFTWNAETKAYALTATGLTTNVTLTGVQDNLTGSCVRTLWLGKARGRAASYNGEAEISSLKISNEEDYGTILTSLPVASKEGYRIGWYDAASNGNLVETYTVSEDKTLYANWIEQKKLTYNYQVNETFAGTVESYFNTGLKIDYNKDFEIETTFRIDALDTRYLIIGSYSSSSVKPCLNIEVSAANKIRVYILGNYNLDASSTDLVSANEDITLKFIWNAAAKTYTLTAVGTNTNITMSSIVDVKGPISRTLTLGQDHRGSAQFAAINISSLKIIESEDINSTIDELPNTTKNGNNLEWFDSIGGNKVTSVTMNDDKTIYAGWLTQKSLTYDYNISEPLEFDGTDDSYSDTGFILDWDKNFEIEETFRIEELGKRYLIIDSFKADNDGSNSLMIDITTGNNIRILMYGKNYSHNISYSGTLKAKEDITLKFTWNVATQTFRVTAKGNVTDFDFSNKAAGMAGKSLYTLMLGQDHRGYAVFAPIKVKSLKITSYESEGATINELPVQAKEGYTFNWYDAALNGSLVSSVTMDSNKTIYANYTPNIYSIILNHDGETDTIYYQYNSSKEISGDTCYYFTSAELTECVSDIIPTKEHYVFEGYYTELNGEGTKYVNDESEVLNNLYQLMPSEIDSNYTDAITLYANWVGEDITVTLPDGTEETYHYGDSYTFGTNNTPKADEVGATITFRYLDGVTTDTEATVTKSYTPAGWLVDEIEYEDGEVLILTENIEVEYNYTETGISPVFPEPTREHYEFDGWYDEVVDGNEVTSYTGLEDITLYAHWTGDGSLVALPVNDIEKADEVVATVTFDPHNGNATTTSNVIKTYRPNGWLVNGDHYDDGDEVDSSYTPVPDYIEVIKGADFPSRPTKTDSEFTGWFTAETGGTLTTIYNETEDITLHAQYTSDYAYLGYTINSKMNAYDGVTTFRKATAEEYNSAKNTFGANNVISVDYSPKPVYMWKSGTNILYYSEASTIFMLTGAEMFSHTALTSIDLSGINTSKVTDMTFMFWGASSLSNLNISSFDTNKVTSMAAMFSGCSSLTSLDVSSFNTSNVTSMDGMFNGMYSLTSLDVSSFDTSNVTGMGSMFSSCSSLTSLDISSFDTSKVTNMYAMFDGMSSLTSLDVSSFDTSNVTSMGSMFSSCSSLTSLDLHSFNTSKVTDMRSMFSNCRSLTSLDINPLDTSNVTSMDGMFNGMTNLTSLDLHLFNTSKVTDMSNMFRGMSSLTSLDISPLDTSNVTNMSGMFSGMTNLASLDLRSFNTSKVTDMSSMLSNMNNLTSLNLSSLDTSNVTNMSYMFRGMTNLASLDLRSFNTSKVTDMSYMFKSDNASTKLKTIYVSDKWSIASVTTSTDMFGDCYGLVGESGTRFNSNHTDVTYAHVDEGETNPGYLSSKFKVIYSDGTIEKVDEGNYTLLSNNIPKDNDNIATVTFIDGATTTTSYVQKSYTPNGWLIDGVHYEDGQIIIVDSIINVDADYIETIVPVTLEALTKEHYSFDGWYDESTGGTKYEGTYSEEENLTLYAHWTGDEITVTLPDGTEETYNYGDSYTFGTNNTPKASENMGAVTFKYQDNETADTVDYVVKSYTPAGWLVGADEYADGAVLVLTENIEIEYNYTETLTSPSFPEPTREHYTFDGWYDAAESGLEVTTYTGSENINLFAYWTGEEITVTLPDGTEETYHYADSYTFGTNDVVKANENMGAVTFKYQDNETADTVDYVVKSFTPAGWLVGATEYADGAVLVLTENIEIEYNYTETLTSPSFPEPTREHYSFDGWYDAAESGLEVTEYTGSENINLFAYWTGEEVTVTLPDGTEETYNYGYSYTFGTNDVVKANENMGAITFKYQDNETADTVDYVVKSFTPAGWLVGATEYADGTVLVLTENIEIEYNYTETLTSPVFPEPTRDNYAFDGWFDSEENGNEVTEYTGSENINLFAYWTILAPTDFDVDTNELTLLVDETHQIVPTFIPAGTTDTLVYSEYDNEVVSVVDGLITGLAAGETTIKVSLTSNSEIYKTISVTVLSNELLSGSLDVKTMPLGRIIIGEEPQTALEDFLSKIDNPSEYLKVYNSDNELVEDDSEFAKTGMKVKLVINNEVIDEAYVVVRGDLDGDGYVDASDGIIHQNIILEKPEYDGYKLDYRAYAADLDYDPNETEEIIIDATDGNILDNKILEKIDSLNH